MKKLLFMAILLSNFLFALGGINSLPDDEKQVALSIKESLKLTDAQAYKIYTSYVQAYLTSSDKWNVHYFDNTDPSRSKIDNSPIRSMFMGIANNTRLVNISFVKFPVKKQMLIYVVETLPRAQSLVLKKYNQLVDDSKFKKTRDTAHFAIFSKTGYMSKVNIFTGSVAGAIQYEDLYIEDLD